MSDLKSSDPLWNLLGKASKHEPSPMFVKDVLRSVRLSEDRQPRGLLCFLRDILVSRIGFAASVCGVIALAIIGAHTLSLRVQSIADASILSEASYEVSDPASEMVAVAYLGQLMTVSDLGQLDDESLSDLFF